MTLLQRTGRTDAGASPDFTALRILFSTGRTLCASSLAGVLMASAVHAAGPEMGPPEAEPSEEQAAPAEPEQAAPAEPEQATQAESKGQPGDWLPGKFSSVVALTSNYMSRGITQTDNNPAIQGSIEYAIETGVLGTSAYIRGFGSNAKLKGDTDTAHVEIDALFGFRGDIGDTGLSWDVGGAYYSYPGATRRDNFNYWEIPILLTYKATDWLEIEFDNYPTPEYQFNTGAANYTSGLATFTIPNDYVGLKAFAGVGYQYIEQSASGTDWTLGATVTIKGIDFTIAYVDTNYNAHECGGNNQCDAKAIFTVGAEF